MLLLLSTTSFNFWKLICSCFFNLWKLTTVISLNYGNQLQIINLLLGVIEVVHYSHCNSLPWSVEHLTHSQQKLDGSMAINSYIWSPSSLTQSPSALHHQVRVSRAWKCLQIACFCVLVSGSGFAFGLYFVSIRQLSPLISATWSPKPLRWKIQSQTILENSLITPCTHVLENLGIYIKVFLLEMIVLI